MTEEKKSIQLELDNETSKGVYANAAIIFNNENEFVVDFAFIHPSKAKIVSRVITSPSHIKRLQKALAENIAQFEKKFGPIKDVPGPDQNLNIKLSNN
jgi:hypothetical protein